MATTSRVTPWGWEQGDDSADSSRVTPGGWEQVVGAGGGSVSGAVAYANANDTSSASGTTTVTGTLAKSNASDTSAASGTTTVLGASSLSNADDTAAASGSVGSTGSTGTVNVTNANDTSAAAGTTTVTGTVARSNVDDSVSASGWAGLISGTVNASNASDTVSASGDAGAAVVVGFGGGWDELISLRRRRNSQEPIVRAVEAAIVQAVEAIPAPKKRQTLTLSKLVGKQAAAQISTADARRMKRKRDDEFLLLM